MSHLKVFVLFVFLGHSFVLFAQDETSDSLKFLLDSRPEDTSRVNLYNEIAAHVYRSAPQDAISYGTRAQILAEKLEFPSGLAMAYKNVGLGHYMLGSYPEAVKSWESSLLLYEQHNDEQMISNLISNLGSAYYTMGQSSQAIEYWLRSLKMAEGIGDYKRIATLQLNIGAVYSEQESSLDSARSFYFRAMATGENNGYTDLLAVGSMNLGQVYFRMEDYDSALYYFEKSLLITTNEIDRASAMNDIGRIYTTKGEFEAAIEYQDAALVIARAENAQMEIVKILLGLASSYQEMDEHKRAIEYFQEAKLIARETGLQYELASVYEGLATSYARVYDYRNAYKFLNLQNELDNAILKLESEDKTRGLMFTYQLDKKQDEIELLEHQSLIENLRSKRQKGVILAIGLFGVLLIFLAAGIYNRMRFIRKTNHKIALQNKYIEEQRDELQGQHDLVLNQKKLITDSISYAQRIQSALLPSDDMLKEVMPDHFTILKPKDIVSGDFYWIREVQDHLVIVAADCTGHGVPGAFMSMLGMTLLNDLIGDRCYDAPSAILDQLREKIKELLEQEGKVDEQKDGMDAALVVLNKKTREIHFSGANNPLYIIRNRELNPCEKLEALVSRENEDYRLFEIKPDKQPIGTYTEEVPFRTHSVYLEPNDSFYLFSDGFIDQFGGERRKKFMSGNFKKLLLSVQDESMEKQKNILEHTFEDWRGTNEQIDDVSVIGVKLN